MKTGILERVLVRRHGQAVVGVRRGLNALCWNPDDFDFASVLYVGMKWHGPLATRFASLKAIYGNAVGGFLIKNMLKVAVLLPHKIYGLWRIDELQILPPVKRALAIDPAIDFFMDSANVWFYGHKAGELYVFDSETDELDSLGPIEPALETVLDELEAAGQQVRDS
jgi:hypothetical protein